MSIIMRIYGIFLNVNIQCVHVLFVKVKYY